MDSILDDFLVRQTPFFETTVVWGDGAMPLRERFYFGEELPPLGFVTSVRSFVFKGDQILVLKNRNGAHLLPGGRREAGETLEETLRREVLEESGWTVSGVVRDAFLGDYSAWRKGRFGDYTEVLLPDRFRTVLQQKDSERKDVEQVVQKMMVAFEGGYPELLRLTPGAMEMLRAWKGKARLAVVSNFFLAGWPDRLLGAFHVSGFFEFVIDSAEVGSKKPGEEIYTCAFEMAGVTPENSGQVLFVGDNLENDVLAPMRIGMQTVYFDRSKERPMANQAVPEGVRVITPWEPFRPL